MSSNSSAQQWLTELRASLGGTQYSTSAIYASVVVAFAGSACILVLILLLWHPLRSVYAPQPMLESHQLAIATNSAPRYPALRTCISASLHMTEMQLLQRRGLDAFVYLRALTMLRNIFGVFTVVTFVVVCPINVVYNRKHQALSQSLTKCDPLLLLTPIFLEKNQMIAHVILAYVTNIVVFLFIRHNYERILRARQTIMATADYNAAASHRTLMLLSLPKTVRDSDDIMNLATKICAGGVAPLGATLGRDTSAVRKLVEKYNEMVRIIERIVTENNRYLRKGKADKVISTAKLEAELSQQRRYIEVERATKVSTSTNYGFLTFPQSHRPIELCKEGRKTGFGVRLHPAAEPNEILWANLSLSEAERGTKQLLMNLLCAALIALWVVPSALIGCFLSDLNRLANVWPEFNSAMAKSPVGFALLQGVLAPSITSLVFAALPYIFRRVSFVQGKITRHEREKEVLRKLYAFFFIDNFVIFTIMGMVWDIVTQVLAMTDNASLTAKEVWNQLQVAKRIASAMVSISSFWVMYLLRSVTQTTIEAAQFGRLLMTLGRKANFVKSATPRENVQESLPRPFQFAVNYLHLLFNATIALCFTTIQPLVFPIAFVLFSTKVPVKVYELNHISQTKYESYGSFWPLVCDILLLSTVVGNLVLLCVVWAQASWQMACTMIPLPLMVLLFKTYISWSLECRFNYPDIPPDTSLGAQSLEPMEFLDPILTSKLDTPQTQMEQAIAAYSNSLVTPNVLQQANKAIIDSVPSADDSSQHGAARSTFNELNISFRHLHAGAEILSDEAKLMR